MRTPEEYHQIIALSETMNNSQIARELGIPRGTIRGILKRHATLPDKTRTTYYRHPQPSLLPSLSRLLPEDALAPDYAYLLGMYLGDGCINTIKYSARIRIALDCKYSGIIEECHLRSARLYPHVNICCLYRPGCVNITWYAKTLPEDFPQHGAGSKHTRPIVLLSWQENIVQTHPKELIRGLIHSDGCRDVNMVNGRGYPRYSFSNMSSDIHSIFHQALENLEIAYTTKSNGRMTFVARRNFVEYIDTFVGPKHSTYEKVSGSPL
jgi:hypothetical protein